MKLIDREIAWLSFNSRVLEQAEDTRLPALERLRFLSIFQSNLDEFYMKRLAPPRAQAIHNNDEKQIERVWSIHQTSTAQLQRSKDCAKDLKNKILPKEGLHILSWKELSDAEKNELKDYFLREILPVLTPLSVDKGHPFPHISSLSTSLGVKLSRPNDSEHPLFARVKIPDIFDPFIRINRGVNSFHWLPMSVLIEEHLYELFPGMQIQASLLFRITRNIEFERDEEEAEDILEMIANELHERKFGHTVKFQCRKDPDPWLLNFLKEELGLHDFDIFQVGEHIDYTKFNSIYKQGPSRLKFPKWKPLTKKVLTGTLEERFDYIKQHDVLLHHPYESYKYSIEQIIVDAANDPKVLGIKLSLYRTNQDSRLVQALVKAVENGKEVVCVIELKARLDEANNISWAQVLENAGAHIVYGMVGLKTHCKIALITRKEETGLQCYAHIGTGNYNADTAAFYTDTGLITAKRKYTEDVVNVFHFLTGLSTRKSYNKLLVAPVNLREKLTQFIKKEIQNAKQGIEAEITFKFNNLEDRKICELLYEAAEAGVKVNLGVRSICVLPSTKNLKIHSIVDQFLEHSRIYYFRNGSTAREDGKIFIGSADLMTRNLDRRVEVLTPIEDKKIILGLLNVLEIFFKDNTQKWILNSNDEYVRDTTKKRKNYNFQLELRRHYLKINE